MAEENALESSSKFKGGEVLFAGGTDWGFIGRNLGGSKKKGDADVRLNASARNGEGFLSGCVLDICIVTIVGCRSRGEVSELGQPCTAEEPFGKAFRETCIAQRVSSNWWYYLRGIRTYRALLQCPSPEDHQILVLKDSWMVRHDGTLIYKW